MNNLNQTCHDEDSISSSCSDLCPWLLQPTGNTGCEDTVEDKAQFKISKELKLATWNCGGLKITAQELCRELEYDVLVLTETHDKGYLKRSRNYITVDPAPESNPYSTLAIILSDSKVECAKHSGSCGSRIAFVNINDSHATCSSLVFISRTPAQSNLNSLQIPVNKLISSYQLFYIKQAQ